MRKTEAVKLEPGTLVFFELDCDRAFLGEVERVTPRGGVLVTPVKERFGDTTTLHRCGPDMWLPYSKIARIYQLPPEPVARKPQRVRTRKEIE